MPLYALDDVQPEIADTNRMWVAPNAQVIGNVRIGVDVGIWFGAVLRGDNEPITLGAGTNIQENVVVHTDPDCPVEMGTGCTIGHSAIIHGCTLGDNVLIGMGATVLNKARIGANSLVGANALVTEGKSFPEGSLIMGSPAKVIRTLSEAQIDGLKSSAARYIDNYQRFKSGLSAL
jgi:carbonic anhydrase/acetyltransferase-like protein (isoleucine patch superfamily)